MKFAKEYSLLCDLPTHKAGSKLGWDGVRQFFYFDLPKEREFDLSRRDYDGPKFTVDQVQDTKWFKAVGKLRPFVPPFPSRKCIEQYASLDAECRMVDEVDECRALNGLIFDPKFQQRLYDFYKQEYDKFYNLNGNRKNGKK